MKQKKQTYDQIYARAYYAGLRFGLGIEKAEHAKELRAKIFMFWVVWVLLALNVILGFRYSLQAGRLGERNDLIEYRAKEFLYERYRSGASDITDQMNALGFEEDVLGLEFQKIEALIDSGVSPGEAKKKVLTK